MPDVDPKPLADLLFGSQGAKPPDQEVGLAEVLSAWVRASRGRVRESCRSGTRPAKDNQTPRPEP